MTEDPTRDGPNWLIYVGNNPINKTDPTGMSAQSPFTSVATMGMVGAIGSPMSSLALGTSSFASYGSPGARTHLPQLAPPSPVASVPPPSVTPRMLDIVNSDFSVVAASQNYQSAMVRPWKDWQDKGIDSSSGFHIYRDPKSATVWGESIDRKGNPNGLMNKYGYLDRSGNFVSHDAVNVDPEPPTLGLAINLGLSPALPIWVRPPRGMPLPFVPSTPEVAPEVGARPPVVLEAPEFAPRIYPNGPGNVNYDPNYVPGPNPNALTQRVVTSPTAGEGGVYLKPQSGATKVGSTGDFQARYGPNGGIEVEIPQTRTGPPPGVADSEYPWTARAQRRFDEEYIYRITPSNVRYAAPKAKSPVSQQNWEVYRHIFGYGDVPSDFGQ